MTARARGNTRAIARPQSTALAKRSDEQTIVYAFNQTELDEETADAENLLATIESGTIDNDEDLHEANDLVLKAQAAIKRIDGVRVFVVAPINKKKDELQARFNAALGPLKKVVAAGKRLIGGYQLKKDEEQRQLYAQTSESLDALSHEELSEALAVAQESAPVKLAGTSVKFRYTIKRVNMQMLADEWKTYDAEKINAYADRCGGEEPIIPGVIWERVADVRATGRG